MQIGFSAKGAGPVELIAIPTCAYCVENPKLQLQLSMLIYYQPSVVYSSKNSGLYLALFLLKLPREAFTHCGAGVEAAETNKEVVL